MSILDKASLIQIPSGYKSTKLYSLRPINGDGDFTFSRSSSATRVNSEGLIETAQVLGNEEIVNGDFATDSDWTINDWSISGGSLNGSSSTGIVFQNPSGVVVGKTYKVTLEVKSYTSGSIRIKFGGSSYSNVASEVSVQEFYIQAVTTGGFLISVISSFTGSIDNVSVKEVIKNDVPRLDYSGGASCASLLLEPQRTNLITYSDLSSGFTTTNVTLSNNQGTSPDGTSNATKALMASGTGTHRVYDAISSSLNDDNVLSVFIKEQNDISHIGLHADTMSNQCWFSGSDGSIINANGLDAKTESFGNGWHRISVHYVADANDAGDNQFIYFSNREFSNPTPAFDGTEEILLYGIQAEKGKYPTSLIPTSGASATRTADVCNNAGTSATFNSTEGVLFAEIAALADDGTDRRISLSDGTSNNIITIGYSRFSTNIVAEVFSGGVLQNYNWGATGVTQTNNNKFALYWGSGTMKFYVNGNQTNTESATSPTALNVLEFNTEIGTLPMYGKCKQLMVFDEALSDEELSDLTGQVNLSFNNLATFYGYTIL